MTAQKKAAAKKTAAPSEATNRAASGPARTVEVSRTDHATTAEGAAVVERSTVERSEVEHGDDGTVTTDNATPDNPGFAAVTTDVLPAGTAQPPYDEPVDDELPPPTGARVSLTTLAQGVAHRQRATGVDLLQAALGLPPTGYPDDALDAAVAKFRRARRLGAGTVDEALLRRLGFDVVVD